MVLNESFFYVVVVFMLWEGSKGENTEEGRQSATKRQEVVQQDKIESEWGDEKVTQQRRLLYFQFPFQPLPSQRVRLYKRHTSQQHTVYRLPRLFFLYVKAGFLLQ